MTLYSNYSYKEEALQSQLELSCVECMLIARTSVEASSSV